MKGPLPLVFYAVSVGSAGVRPVCFNSFPGHSNNQFELPY